ncbi:MAG: hypothetical protein Pars2KO_00100 [Parasphingorhabdus sp.]
MFNKLIKKIAKNKRGNVLALTGLTAPIFIGFAGLSIDVGYGLYSKSQLRGATESAALDIAENYTAPNNFSFHNARELDRDPLVTNGLSISKGGLPKNHRDVAIQREDIEIGEWDVESRVFTPVGSSPIVNAARVKGEMSDERNNKISTFFGKMFGFNPDLHSQAMAIAPLIPGFHFLNPTASGALRQSDGSPGDSSDLDISDIWINSDAHDALIAGLHGHNFGATGAYIKGGATLFHDRFHEDVFRLPDLLAKQPEPARPWLRTQCDEEDLEIDTLTPVTLNPGTYCGGLNIMQSSSVTFSPGLYQFLDGPLVIAASPRVFGRDVLLHFDGPGAAINVQGSSVFFSGPTTGINKGLVIFSSRDTTGGIAHRFTGSRAEFVGTYYAPDNRILVSGSRMNGNCHSLCLVADTMSVTNRSFLNWYHGFDSLTFFNDVPRVAPTALEPYLSPYLISS